MRIDQSRQQRLFAKIDNVPGVTRLDVIKSANADDPICRDSDRTVFDRCSVHRHNNARADNHWCLL
jgi:hypothetical protein